MPGVMPLMPVKLMVVLAKQSKRVVKDISDHVILAEENIIFK